ncbi:MAG: hypothetical protein ACJ8AO_02330 [Gemmatimonadaceae bacterium]
MTARSVLVLTSVLAAAGLALAVPAPAPAAAERALARAEQDAAFRAGEVARIQRHFDSVLVELRTADVARLTPSQRASRARQLARLAAYRDRGVFPRNEHFPDSVLPYFVDRSGTRCAVAHLMHLDGREPIVRHVAATRNNAWVAELRDEPGLAAWLDEAGLTLDEAARIQVPYMGDPAPAPSDGNVEATAARVGTAYAAASAVAGLAAGASVAYALRADAPSRRTTLLGLAAGATGIALGAPRLGDGGAATAIGAANTAVGLAATAVALRTLFHEHTANAASARKERAVSVAPVLGRQAGFTVAARF